MIRQKTLLGIAFAAWLALWLMFISREAFVKDRVGDYRALFGRTLEGKRSHVMGDDLYGFITFCRAQVPVPATFALIGLEDGSVDLRRAAYYLYPLVESGNPDYIFVFRKPGYAREGYDIVARLDDDRLILKRGIR